MADPVPVEVIEAAVGVCGSAFHYKAQLRGILVSCGVPGELYDRWNADGLSKFGIARHVLADLAGRGAAGQDVVRRVVDELANLSRPDLAAPDQHAGRQAIADLKALAVAQAPRGRRRWSARRPASRARSGDQRAPSPHQCTGSDRR